MGLVSIKMLYVYLWTVIVIPDVSVGSHCEDKRVCFYYLNCHSNDSCPLSMTFLVYRQIPYSSLSCDLSALKFIHSEWLIKITLLAWRLWSRPSRWDKIAYSFRRARPTHFFSQPVRRATVARRNETFSLLLAQKAACHYQGKPGSPPDSPGWAYARDSLTGEFRLNASPRGVKWWPLWRTEMRRGWPAVMGSQRMSRKLSGKLWWNELEL